MEEPVNEVLFRLVVPSLRTWQDQLEGSWHDYDKIETFDSFWPEVLKTRIARIECGSHAEGFVKSGHILRNSV